MNEKVGVIGAIGAAIVASICCIGPVVLAGLGIGAVAAAQALTPYGPLFLAITGLFLAAGFYFAYRKPREAACDGEVCETPRVARWGRPLLWIATIIVVALVAFPYYYAPLRGALEGPVQPGLKAVQGARLTTAEFAIGGMSCEGCAATVKYKLLEAPGVVWADVRYAAGSAQVKYDPAKTDPRKLAATVESLGYRASPPNRN